MPQDTPIKKRGRGRPPSGNEQPLHTRVRPEIKNWLAELRRASGLREGELVRRVLDDARARGWSAS